LVGLKTCGVSPKKQTIRCGGGSSEHIHLHR
jgi:hypothetical protein